jgi:hypothetical protein
VALSTALRVEGLLYDLIKAHHYEGGEGMLYAARCRLQAASWGYSTT